MIYERQDNIDEENAVLQTIAAAWNVTPYRYPTFSAVDAALMNDEKRLAIVEVKCRKKRYDTLMIDLSKVQTLRFWTHNEPINGLLVVKWPDFAPHYIDVNRHLQWGQSEEYGDVPTDVTVSVGGRKDRGDSHDLDVCVYIPTSRFVSVHAVRGVP